LGAVIIAGLLIEPVGQRICVFAGLTANVPEVFLHYGFLVLILGGEIPKSKKQIDARTICVSNSLIHAGDCGMDVRVFGCAGRFNWLKNNKYMRGFSALTYIREFSRLYLKARRL